MKKCLICGRPSAAGAKLCADCSSARKRAFAATVTQPLLAAAGARSGARLLRPSQSMAATARRAAERSLTEKASAPAPVTVVEALSHPRRRAWLMATGAFVVVLAVVVVLGIRRAPAPAKVEAPVAAEQPAPAATPAVSVPVSVPAVTFTAKPGLAAPIADPAEKLPVSQDSPPAARADAAKRAAAKPRTMPVEVTPPPAEPAPVVQPLAAAPVVAPAPAPPPRVDRWQAMSESLARCTGGLLDRIVCDQRVRAQFCDGQWGQVPQCPTRPPNDHGQ